MTTTDGETPFQSNLYGKRKLLGFRTSTKYDRRENREDETDDTGRSVNSMTSANTWFVGHDNVEIIRKMKIEAMRHANLLQTVHICDSDSEFDRLKELIHHGIKPFPCLRGSTLSSWVAELKGEQRNFVTELMAIDVDGDLAPVLQINCKPPIVPEKFINEGLQKVEGLNVYGTSKWMVIPPEIAGNMRAKDIPTFNESMMSTLSTKCETVSQQLLLVDFYFQSRGTRGLKTNLDLETSVLQRPGELTFFMRDFDECVMEARDGSRKKKLWFKTGPLFNKEVKRTFFWKDQTQIAAYKAILEKKELNAILCEAFDAELSKSITSVVEEHEHEFYDPDSFTEFFPAIWLNGAWWTELHHKIEHIESSDKFVPCRGFFENNALIYTTLASMFCKASYNVWGRYTVGKFITDNVFIWGAIDRSKQVQNSSIRWFIFLQVKEGEWHEVQFGHSKLWEIEERMQHCTEMISVCTVYNTCSLPFLYAVLQALHPTRESYDIGGLLLLLKSDVVSCSANTEGWNKALVKLLDAKSYDKGPTSIRDVLLCDIALLCLKYSSPPGMFMNKILGAPVRASRFDYYNSTVKMSKAALKYLNGEIVVKKQSANDLLSWVKEKAGHLVDVSKVTKYIKQNPPNVNDCVTMNASLDMNSGDTVATSSSASTAFSLLTYAQRNGLINIGSLSAGENVAWQLAPYCSAIFSIFAKEQPTGDRPIAIYNAVARIIFGVIIQIMQAIGQGQDSDLCTRPEIKEEQCHKHLEFRKKRASEGKFTASLFLDITNFCGHMPYGLCSKIVLMLAHECFKGPNGAVGMRTKLLSDLLKAVHSRYWAIKMSTVKTTFMLDVYSRDQWYQQDHTNLILQMLRKDPEPWKLIFSSCLICECKCGTGAVLTSLECPDFYTSDDISAIRFKIKSEIPSWDVQSTPAKRILISPNSDHFFIKLDHGSEEGQVMFMESIAFSVILKYIMTTLGFSESHYKVSVTSDDVLISFSSILVDGNGGAISNRLVLSWAMGVANQIQEMLKDFGIPLSAEKCSVNADKPENPGKIESISFNSRELSADPNDPMIGRFLNNLGRITRSVFVMDKHASLKGSIDSHRSSMINLLDQLPYLNDQEFELFSRAVKLSSIYSSGFGLYPGSLKYLPFESAILGSCPYYRTVSSVYMENIAHEMVSWPSFKKFVKSGDDGYFVIDQKPMLDNSRIDEFRQVMNECSILLSQPHSAPLGADFLYQLKTRSVSFELQPRFFNEVLPFRFGAYFHGNLNIRQVLESPYSVDTHYNPIAKAILDGTIILNENSQHFLPIYSGTCPQPNSLKVFQYLRTIQALTGQKVFLSQSQIESLINNFVTGIGDGGKVKYIYVHPNNVFHTLQTKVNPYLFLMSLRDSMKSGVIPTAVLSNNNKGVTIVYNACCDGSWLIGRDSVLLLKVCFNGNLEEPTDFDYLLNKAFFTEIKKGYIDSSTFDGIVIDYMGDTALHGHLQIFDEKDQVVNQVEFNSENLRTAHGLGQRIEMSIQEEELTHVDVPPHVVLHLKDPVDSLCNSSLSFKPFSVISHLVQELIQISVVQSESADLIDRIKQEDPMIMSSPATAVLSNNLLKITSSKWDIILKPKYKGYLFKVDLSPSGGGIEQPMNQNADWLSLALEIVDLSLPDTTINDPNLIKRRQQMQLKHVKDKRVRRRPAPQNDDSEHHVVKKTMIHKEDYVQLVASVYDLS